MLAAFWRWLTSRFIPRVIPMDPESGGGTMLLFTLRPSGTLGDQNDGTTVLEERTVFEAGTVPFSIIAEMNPDGTLFPATISHIIIYVRAQVADHYFNGAGPLLYANPKISWGWPFSDEPQDMNPQYTTVALWNELSLTTRSIQLPTDQNGNAWTYDSLRGIYAGASVDHVTTQVGVEGYLEVADVWIEVYGEQDPPIRRKKFSGGTYAMTVSGTEYVARLTADEIRTVHEAACAARAASVQIPISLSALALDNLGVVKEDAPPINSTSAGMIAAITEASDIQIQ